MSRLGRTLAGIGIPDPLGANSWGKVHRDLIEYNNLTEGLIYLQVTAGAYGMRDFAGPEEFEPTVFLYADARPLIGEAARDGIKAIFLDDTRWKRRDMQLVTRDLSPSILPGITRAGVLDLLEGSGLHLVERAFTPDEALGAKEAFTTSAGAMVAPVVAIDGKAIGAGKPGPVTRQVQRLYYQAMGADVAAVAPWTMG